MASNDQKNKDSNRILKLAIDKNRGPIILALFGNPERIVLDADELLLYVDNNITRLYPIVEEMVTDGLLVKGVETGEEKGSKSGLRRTYSLSNDFYDECVAYNDKYRNILQKLAEIKFE